MTQKHISLAIGKSMRVSKDGLESSPTLADVRAGSGGRTAADALAELAVADALLRVETVAVHAQVVAARSRIRDDFRRAVEMQQRRTSLVEYRNYR